MKKLEKKRRPIPNVEIVMVAYGFCKNIKILNLNMLKHTLVWKTNIPSVTIMLIDLQILQWEESCPYQRLKNIYLKVPYEEKDEAKKMGAKWDTKKEVVYYSQKQI